MLTGKQLRDARLHAGLTQQQLADKVGFHRLAVGYWENKKGKFSARYGAPKAIVETLGMKYFPTSIRAHAGWGITECENARIERVIAQLAQLHAQRLALARVKCNARTRKGTPCKAMSESGKRRCKFHGGLSTGPKTQAGKKNIARAQVLRWKRISQGKAEK